MKRRYTKIEVEGLSFNEAAECVGGRSVLERMIRGGLLKPIVDEPNLKLFSMLHIKRAFSVVEEKGLPK